MFFIHIETMSDGEDFVSWLDSKKRLAFNDSQEFEQWLNGRHVYPLEFYLDGATYRLENEDELVFFNLGFETAMRLLNK